MNMIVFSTKSLLFMKSKPLLKFSERSGKKTKDIHQFLIKELNTNQHCKIIKRDLILL